jgi:hypothetical protein
VAGAAALVRQQLQAAGQPVGPAALRAYLIAHARDIESKGVDPLSGAGMVRVDVVPPVVRVAIGPGSRPAIRVQVRDDGTMNSITMKLDGRKVTRALGPFAHYRFPKVKRGRHRVVVTAEDSSGNVTTAVRTVVVR